MDRIINHDSCSEVGPLTPGEISVDRERSSFIFRKKIRTVSGRKKLGLAWIVIDPIVTSLIYLFVLTVLKARSDPESLFIGIATYSVLQNSLKSGSVSIKDLTGGFKAERIRTRTMVNSTLKYRAVDTLASTLGIAGILFFVYDVRLFGIVMFIAISQLIGLIFEGIGLSLSLLVRRIPDVMNILNLFLRLMFFAGPVMYPMAATTGLHYQLNLLNPFTYFVETARYFCNLEAVILNIEPVISIPILVICISLAFLGFSRVDRFRWVMTSWS